MGIIKGLIVLVLVIAVVILTLFLTALAFLTVILPHIKMADDNDFEWEDEWYEEYK